MNLTTETKNSYNSLDMKQKIQFEIEAKDKSTLSDISQAYLALQEELTFWNWMNQKFRKKENAEKEKKLSKRIKDNENTYKKVLDDQENEREALKAMMKSEIQEIEKKSESTVNENSNDYQIACLKKEFETLARIKSQLLQEIDHLKHQNPQFTEVYQKSHQVLIRAYTEREDGEKVLRDEISNLLLNVNDQSIDQKENSPESEELQIENRKSEEEIEEWRRELWLLEKSIWKKKEGYYTEEEVDNLVEKAKEETEGYKKYLKSKIEELKASKSSIKKQNEDSTPSKDTKFRSKLSKFLHLSSEKSKKGIPENPYMKEFQQFFETTKTLN